VAGEPNFSVSFGGRRFDPLDQMNNEPAPEAKTWIVQFHTPLSAADKSKLHQMFGLRFTAFLPSLSYIERMSATIAESLRGDPLVRAVVPYLPEMKIASSARQAGSRNDDDSFKDSFFNAVLFDDADAEQTKARFVELGVNSVLIHDDRANGGSAIIRFRLPSPDRLVDLSQIAEVRWIEPVPEIVDDDTVETFEGGMTGLSQIWPHGLHGEGQIIGIIDHGPPDLNHCFFIDKDNNTPRAVHRKVVAIRNASNTSLNPHATFVAGCAAGDDVNAPGTAEHRGGAWAAKLASGNRLDLLDLNGRTLFAELTFAGAAGALIHSNSWHGRSPGAKKSTHYDQFSADVDAFTWANEDHVVLGSSGNTGEQQGPPGTAKNAICVSAAAVTATGCTLGDGCSGPTADSRRKPDLLAPGCSIQSAIVGTPCGTGPRSQCASSYATPIAAAAAAMVRQYFEEGYYPTGSKNPAGALKPSGALVKAVMLNSTVKGTSSVDYPSDSEGWGLIQLHRTLFFANGPRRAHIWDVRNSQGLITGESRERTIEIENSAEPLRITLVWTEPPSAVGSDNSVVNNLDLVVTSPDRAVFLGNVFAGNVSVIGGTGDAINNVEMVAINNPPVGAWKISVRAIAVNVGNPGQGFAIVASGGLAASRDI
jgi:hypothetical protein